MVQKKTKKTKGKTKVKTNTLPSKSEHKLPLVVQAEDEWEMTEPTQKEMGLVQLTLDKGVKTTAIGTIYGLDFEVEGKGFQFRAFFDYYNKRLKVLAYETSNYPAMVKRLSYLASENNFDKIFIKAQKSDWQRFLELGFMLEGIIKYFYDGEDAFVLSKFTSVSRSTSIELINENSIIEKIMQTSQTRDEITLPPGYKEHRAVPENIPSMVKLYRRVFATYPSPLTHPDYIQQTMQRNILYRVISNPKGKIISAASADIDTKHLNAELTDCATLKKERGKGLMRYLLKSLENDIITKDIYNAYTLCRAMSRSMNKVFYSLGYEYSGRLVNNCDIFGKFEDMNIWVKKLNKKS